MKLKHIARPFQVKDVSDEGTFSGYGSVFGVKDSYGDVVVKGAFAKSLDAWAEKGKLPKLLWQHRMAEPIGVWLDMKEDDHGLLVKGRLALKTQRGAEAHELVKIGAVDGLSIGYSVPLGGIEFDKTNDAYLLKQIDLWETSLVTFPANPEAEVETVKTAIDGGPKDFERYLREAGLTRSQAKGLMARGYEGLRDLREADDAEHMDAALSNAISNLRAMRG